MKMIPSIGISDFKRLIEDDNYYVDKTLLIKEFLDRKDAAILIARPEKFGKTLNISMMANFFDITKDSKDLFKNTEIMKTDYAGEINQWPIISISFANAKGSENAVVNEIKNELMREYRKYEELFSNLTSMEEICFKKIIEGFESSKNSLEDIVTALTFLMELLHKEYKKNVMLFIDEYDTPLINGVIDGFYNGIKEGIAVLIRKALVSTFLEYAMITGISSPENKRDFSIGDNVKVFTVKDFEYAEYFGFNKEETKKILNKYASKMDRSFEEMYKGYHIGKEIIYNPWSVTCYISKKHVDYFWKSKQLNELMKNRCRYRINSSLMNLYDFICTNNKLTFAESLECYETELIEMLINIGFLTITHMTKAGEYSVQFPNMEVKEEFRRIVFSNSNSSSKELNEALTRRGTYEF